MPGPGVVPRIDLWYNQGHTSGMKTAISIPDRLFRAGERAARKLGMSRSQLYATALAEYVKAHVPTDVTKRLDAVYAEHDSRLAPELDELQRDVLEPEAW